MPRLLALCWTLPPGLLLTLCAVLCLGCAVSTARAQQGTELVLGMSAPFTGPSRGLGYEFYRGAMAAFQEEARLRPYGLPPMRLICRDDAYDPLRTLQNTIAFMTDDKVFCLFGYVGTPTTLRILPLLARDKDAGLPLLFPFTGASSLRHGRQVHLIAHLRASYADEAEAMVARLLATGRRRIAIFYQADSFGRSGWESLRTVLARQGLQIYTEATYARGSDLSADYTPAVARILPEGGQPPPDAVLCVGQYSPTAGFIRDARKAGLDALMLTMSFVDTDNLLLLLRQESVTAGKDLTRRVIGSQVVPCYEDEQLPAVRDYRLAMERVVAPTPALALVEQYTPLRYSMVGFEGFLSARLFLEAVRRTGTDLQREGLLDALRSMGNFDLGIEAPLNFGPTSLRASRRVYFTTYENGRLVPLRQWEAVTP
ncbi:ABC transporter substrate-binding protein [Megalodesulfovibrio paquesii]